MSHPHNCQCNFCRGNRGESSFYPPAPPGQLTKEQCLDLMPRAWELHIKGEKSDRIAELLLSSHDERLELHGHLTKDHINDLIRDARHELIQRASAETIEDHTERYVSQQTAVMHDAWVRLQNLPAHAPGASQMQRNVMEAANNIAKVYDVTENRDRLRDIEQMAIFRHVVMSAIERAAPDVAEIIKAELKVAMKAQGQLTANRQSKQKAIEGGTV